MATNDCRRLGRRILQLNPSLVATEEDTNMQSLELRSSHDDNYHLLVMKILGPFLNVYFWSEESRVLTAVSFGPIR